MALAKMVVPLDRPPADDEEAIFTNSTVGGKALHLAEMIAHGKIAGVDLIKVPAASVVTTAAYDAHVAALSGLEELLDKTLEVGGTSELERIRSAIESPSSNDEGLQADINEFLDSCPATTHRFAVRSSSTAEDQAAASFAGQYATCLNVPRCEILTAVKRCWASMWTERIFSYRESAGFVSDAKPSMAVVIQQQVNSDAAGVAFSLNPVNGHQNESVVEAVWGQGEGLVGGSLTPHSYHVDWHQAAILDTSTRAKQMHKFALLELATADGEYISRVATSEHEQNNAPLTDAQVMSISTMALKVAAVYGVPYDIEWAREGEVIYLLQARPITSFSLQVDGLWDYDGFNQSCVLKYSTTARAYAAMMSQALPNFSYSVLSRMFFCKAYINSDLWRNYIEEYRNKEMDQPVSALVPPVRQRIESSIAHFQQTDTLRQTHSVDSLISLLKLQDELITSSYIVGEAAEIAQGVVDQYICLMNQDFGASLTLAPIVDGINFASEAKYSSTVMSALGVLCASCPPLFELFQRSGTVAEARSLQDGNAKITMAQFDAFIARFFFMSNRDEDVSVVRWADDPSVPWAIFGSLVRGAEPVPPAEFEMHLKNVQTMISSPTTTVKSRETEVFTQGREELITAIRAHISTYVTAAATAAGAAAAEEEEAEEEEKEEEAEEEAEEEEKEEEAEAEEEEEKEEEKEEEEEEEDDTEAHISNVNDAIDALRELFHLKEQIHDVYTHNNFFLRQQIVHVALEAGLAEKSGPHWNGTTFLRTHPIFALDYDGLCDIWAYPLAEQKRILQNAHLEVQMFRLFKNPPQVGAKVEKHVIESVSSFGHEESFGDVIYSGSQIKGVGCSAGIVTGTARIIESLDDSATMQRGDILLTHYTDPSWTTLMSLARGIVLVGGGILSHAAVVARELKIPCIVQLKETMSITSGSTITIDGTKGIVKIETLLEN